MKDIKRMRDFVQIVGQRNIEYINQGSFTGSPNKITKYEAKLLYKDKTGFSKGEIETICKSCVDRGYITSSLNNVHPFAMDETQITLEVHGNRGSHLISKWLGFIPAGMYDEFLRTNNDFSKLILLIISAPLLWKLIGALPDIARRIKG